MEKTTIIKSLIYKYIESIANMGIVFIIQVVLARILVPNDYGIISVLSIFINVSQVLIQGGVNTALIQHKDLEKNDYSSVFWVCAFISAFSYALLFCFAPAISSYFEMPELVDVLRVLALLLIPSAYSSIAGALLTREMKFKKLMFTTTGATVVSGTLGIVLAYNGFGCWALVIQQICYRLCEAVALLYITRWFPHLYVRKERIKVLYSFGWKLLTANLIEMAFNELQTALIGKAFRAEVLGYYTRGKQFPSIIAENAAGSIKSVMLSALSKVQDDQEKTMSMMRRTLIASAYIMFPILFGLAAISRSLVIILLTEKWLPCVPFLQVFCIYFISYPMHIINLQVLNAQGRSDIFLKLEVAKKSISMIIVLGALAIFKSPLIVAISGSLCMLLSCLIDAYPNGKILGYGFLKQIRDILPSLILSSLMFVIISLVRLLALNELLLMIIQIIAGAIIYIGCSKLLKMEIYTYLKTEMKRLIGKTVHEKSIEKER